MKKIYFISKFIKKHYQQLSLILPSRLLKKLEYKKQTFFGFNERPLEYSFVFKYISKLCPTNILDVGTGITALPQLMRKCGPFVIAIDNSRITRMLNKRTTGEKIIPPIKANSKQKHQLSCMLIKKNNIKL